MKEFERQFPKPKSVAGMVNDDPLSWWEEKQEGWKAALEWVLKLCPTNENATFANQGQGMDGYSELANYKEMYRILKK